MRMTMPGRSVSLMPLTPLYDRIPTHTTWNIFSRPKSAQVIVVDEVEDERGKPRSAYWWADVPLEAIQHFNPLGFGRYRQIPAAQRRLAWLIISITPALLGAVATYFSLRVSGPADTTAQALIGASIMIGIMAGVLLGFPSGWLVVRLFLKSRIIYGVWRVNKETASRLDLPCNQEDKFTLVWMTPSPVLPATQEDALAMVSESELAMWQYENLLRGVNGYSTEKYLQGITGARQREDVLKGRNVPPVSMDRNPSDRPGPADR